MPRPSFSSEDAAEILNLPTEAIRTLVNGGTIRAEELEGFLRDGLLSLYRAEARAADELPEETLDLESETLPQPVMAESHAEPTADAIPEPMITRSLAEYESDAKNDRPNLRMAPRYTPRRQLGGTFRQVRFTIMQMSMTGLRIRHDETLRPGDAARLTFSVLAPARTFSLQARVVWTSIAQRADGRSFCISGLRVTDGMEQLRMAIDMLREARELQLAEEDPAPRRNVATSPTALTGLADEEVAEIIRAVRKLSSDPVEANRWMTRARFALADEEVRRNAPTRPRDREEVVSVWEYLERRLDIRKVAGVVLWLRQTRASSATMTA
ncbi:MAG TPA: PilZ domain-containing protein [Thermoanaerobaculia bacterium]|nr:PilZ domain-containing protein [Thermoanaerobaculia bacterium]